MINRDRELLLGKYYSRIKLETTSSSKSVYEPFSVKHYCCFNICFVTLIYSILQKKNNLSPFYRQNTLANLKNSYQDHIRRYNIGTGTHKVRVFFKYMAFVSFDQSVRTNLLRLPQFTSN